MPLLSKASNVVQNVFFLYDFTGFTQIGHSIPVATNCTMLSPVQTRVPGLPALVESATRFTMGEILGTG